MRKEWQNLPWYQRAICVLGGFAAFLIACAGVMMVMYVVSSVIDFQTEGKANYEHCLKQATTGSEIKECERK